MKDKALKTLRIALVALFLSYYGGSTLFFHSHTLGSGTITHSHPYIPSGNHTHTHAGYQFIDHLTHFTFIASVAHLTYAITTVKVRFNAPTIQRVLHFASPHCPLRAPPLF